MDIEMPHTKENYVREPFRGTFATSMLIDEAADRIVARMVVGRTFSSGAHPSSEVINTHNELLSTLSDKNKSEEEREKAEEEFDRLYELNFLSFRRLHELEKKSSDIDSVTVRLLTEREKYRERKESVLSAIKWHFNNERERSLTSYLIIIGFCLLPTVVLGLGMGLGIGLGLLTPGGAAATALPLIIYLSLACIALAIAIVTAVFDQKHAVKKFAQIVHELQEVSAKQSAIYREVRSLVFSKTKNDNSKANPSPEAWPKERFFTLKPIPIPNEEEELRASIPEFYTQDQLIDMIAQGTLDAERRTLEAELKHLKEEMDGLISRKSDLDQQKNLEKDAEKIMDLRVELSYVHDDIDEKKVKIITLKKRIEELNTKAQAIEQKNKDGHAEASSSVQIGKNSPGDFFRQNVKVNDIATLNNNPTSP